jgi:Ca2+-binding EF-hand superfamily protein
MYDKENTGLISDENFRYILNNLGETMTKEEIAEFYNYADLDENGLINYN